MQRLFLMAVLFLVSWISGAVVLVFLMAWRTGDEAPRDRNMLPRQRFHSQTSLALI
jgi:hypothetical protein